MYMRALCLACVLVSSRTVYANPPDKLTFYLDGKLIEAPAIQDSVVIDLKKPLTSDDAVTFSYDLQKSGVAASPTLRMSDTSAIYQIYKPLEGDGALRLQIPSSLADSVVSINQQYKLPGDFAATTTGNIIVRLKDSTTLEQFVKAIDINVLQITGSRSEDKKVWVLRPVSEHVRIDKLSVDLYATNLFEDAKPELVVQTKFHAHAEYVAPVQSTKQEWHLQRIGITRNTVGGSGVVIGILDTEIDGRNPSLERNLICQYGGCTAPPSSHPVQYHGTAVAGLAAADSRVSTAGICTECSILPMKLGGWESPDKFAGSIRTLIERGADVINISASTARDTAIRNVVSFAGRARKGLGVPIVIAIGNDGRTIECESGLASVDPALIVVGASTAADDVAPDSNFGSCLDLLAPGGEADKALWTTDITGNAGRNSAIPLEGCIEASRNNQDYTTCFKGTSAAAPLVSGTIGLMLALRPRLSAEEISDILHRTADKIARDKASYDANGFSEHYGYGRLNAGAALAYVREMNKADQQ